MTSAGYAVLVFNYRGFGGSGETATRIDPLAQVRDWRNAIGFARSHEALDRSRIALFGSGATGGGNAILAAEDDEGIKAVISQVPIADGRDWLRRMRSDDEWDSFLAAVAADREARGRGKEPVMVPVRGGFMVPTDDVRAGWKRDVVNGVPTMVEVASAEAFLAYRPIDAVRALSPACMFIAVENDSVTPTDHCTSLYEAAAPPKSLILLSGTTHYSAYEQFRSRVTPKMVQWLDAYVGQGGGDPQADACITLSA